MKCIVIYFSSNYKMLSLKIMFYIDSTFKNVFFYNTECEDIAVLAVSQGF